VLGGFVGVTIELVSNFRLKIVTYKVPSIINLSNLIKSIIDKLDSNFRF
jgi:hypothetical protein